MFKKIHEKAVLAYMTGIMVMYSSGAHAATISTMFSGMNDDAEAVGDFFKVAFLVVGFIVLGMGLYKFVQNNPQESNGQKAKMVIIGALLLAIGAVLNVVLETSGVGDQGSSSIKW